MEYDITIKQEDGTLKEIPIHVDAVTSPADDGAIKKVGQVRENNGALEYALDSAPNEWKAIGGGGEDTPTRVVQLPVLGNVGVHKYVGKATEIFGNDAEDNVKKVRVYLTQVVSGVTYVLWFLGERTYPDVLLPDGTTTRYRAVYKGKFQLIFNSGNVQYYMIGFEVGGDNLYVDFYNIKGGGTNENMGLYFEVFTK